MDELTFCLYMFILYGDSNLVFLLRDFHSFWHHGCCCRVTFTRWSQIMMVSGTTKFWMLIGGMRRPKRMM